jgi:hypothetical protein
MISSISSYSLQLLGINQPEAVVLGGLLTLVGGIGGQLINVYVGNRLRRKTQRRKLREVLYAELDSMAWINNASVAEAVEESGNDVSRTFFPTLMFDSNTQDVGLLTEDEINPMLRYYNAAYIAREQLEMVRDTDNSFAKRSLVNDTLPRVKDYRREAAQEIGEKIDREEPSNLDTNTGRQRDNTIAVLGIAVGMVIAAMLGYSE